MKPVHIHGIGAVSPAGWGVEPMREALRRGEPLPVKAMPRPGWTEMLQVRQVPVPASRPAFLSHARLRRTSPIAHYTVAAALEAVGNDAGKCAAAEFQLGIVFCAMTGCVNYSRRFYSEVLKDPATASPLLFPETVYNSPASHLAALLGTSAVNYTLVGDPGTFLQGIALAADWLGRGQVDGCLVIGAEESDWLTSDAMRLFERRAIVSEGAGAVYLRAGDGVNSMAQLRAITHPHLFNGSVTRGDAAKQVRAELGQPGPDELLCDSAVGLARADRDELAAWEGWPGARLSPKTLLGEGFMAGAAWQCVAAVDAIREQRHAGATVSVVGWNEQAIAAQFVRSGT